MYDKIICRKTANFIKFGDTSPRINHSVVFALDYQSQPLQVLPMGVSSLHCVDSGGVHIGVPEDVRKPDDVLLHAVVRPGEQVPQVVGEYLALCHIGGLAQRFHIVPEVAAVQGLPVPGHEYRTDSDFLLLRVLEQQIL